MSAHDREKGFASWLAHAFAIDKTDPGGTEPSEAQRAVLDRLCRELVRRKMTTPALLFLEMSKPLNFLSAQALHFFHPIVASVCNADGYRHFAEYLEKRGSIEWLCGRLEAIEAEHSTRRAKGGFSGGVPPPAAKKGEG